MGRKIQVKSKKVKVQTIVVQIVWCSALRRGATGDFSPAFQGREGFEVFAVVALSDD